MPSPVAEIVPLDEQQQVVLELHDFPTPNVENLEPFFPKPEWQPFIDRSLHERHKANQLSDNRAKHAPIIGAMVLNCEASMTSRIAAAGALAYEWHTDRRDGIHGRKSITILKNLVEVDPLAAQHPQIKELLSVAMVTDGGRRDEQADKALANAVLEALIARAEKSGDYVALAILKPTFYSTVQKRDPVMATKRQFGVKHGLDVGAKSLGKLKTGLLAAGQGAMTLGKPGGGLNRFGLAMIAVSNAPSWAAVWQMSRDLKHQMAELRAQPQLDWIERAPNEDVRLLRIMDAEGEPQSASLAA